MKRALIFGASGQAGSYLNELLVKKGYDVVGTYCSATNRISRKFVRVNLEMIGDIQSIINRTQPDEIYNMAAMMYAPASWEFPNAYIKVNGLAVVQMLESILAYCPKAKFFQAGSAEVFARTAFRQDEDTPRKSTSPYGLSKIIAEEAVKMYREQKGLFACTGIFFNMESMRRSRTFFAEKVVMEAIRLREELNAGKEIKNQLVLGSLQAVRDWGLTEEYIEAAWMMLQAQAPKDFVIGTGESHTCLEFVYEVMVQVGLEKNFEKLVKFEAVPGTDFSTMHANPWLIKSTLGWQAKTRFKGVVKKLVEDAEVKWRG